MGDEDLYVGNVRNYYNTSHIMFPENGGGSGSKSKTR